LLVKPDAQTINAFIRAKGDFQLNKFLQAEKEETYKLLVGQRDEITVRQMQGKLQFLLDLQALIEKSSELATKLGP
jgi:hypothetical protein